MRISLLPILATGFLSIASANAQLLSYESFSDMPLGAVSGTGSDSSGWATSGWSDAVSPYYQCVDPAPDLTYQFPSSSRSLDGGNRALQITTAPEPTSGTNRAFRTFSAQNTTLHASFLVRVANVGSGTDAIEFNVGDSTNAVGRIVFTPNLDGTAMNCALVAPNGFSWGSGPQLPVGQTTHVVMRLARASATLYKVQYWVNGVVSSPFDLDNGVASNAVLSRVSLTSYSGDSGGPVSSLIFDEIRIGYTYDNALPPAPAAQEVTTLAIEPAMRVRWLSKTSTSYQVQKSYNLTNWNNIGASVAGTGGYLEYFDSINDSEAFYKVLIK